VDRKTEILDEIEDIKIDTTKMIPKEDCVVVVTKEGYVKRVSLRSYNKDESTVLKENDYLIGLYQMNTLDTVLLFTDLGNYLYVPVHEIPDLKWKEIGKHISNIISLSSDENIIASIPVYNFDEDIDITLVSKEGIIKRTKLNEFKVTRYSKPMSCMKMKGTDKLVSALRSDGSQVFITTKNGYALRYKLDEVSIIGVKASGVKAINLKDDIVVSANVFEDCEYITVITENGTGKRVKLSEFEVMSRARKGVLLVRDVKTNPYRILKTFVNVKHLGIVKNTIEEIKVTELAIADRYSTGTTISKNGIIDCFEIVELTTENIVKVKKEINEVKENIEEIIEEEILDISLEEVDEKILTIDDFLDDFEI